MAAKDVPEVPDNVTLQIIKGADEGKSFVITGKTMTVGRAPVCDIRLNDNYVSNKHCQIVFRGGHFTVIDLGSLNKTRVNGSMYVQKNLLNEDIIRIGKTELEFSWSPEDQAAYQGVVAEHPPEEDIPVPENDGALQEDVPS